MSAQGVLATRVHLTSCGSLWRPRLVASGVLMAQLPCLGFCDSSFVFAVSSPKGRKHRRCGQDTPGRLMSANQVFVPSLAPSPESIGSASNVT